MVVLKKENNRSRSLLGVHKEKVLDRQNSDSLLNSGYRVRASTLMETLVATVLIVIIFMLASMILNNLFSNTIKNSTRGIDTHLNELEYLYTSNALHLPYYNEFKAWEISIEVQQSIVFLEALNTETKQHITRQGIER